MRSILKLEQMVVYSKLIQFIQILLQTSELMLKQNDQLPITIILNFL